MVYHTRKGVQPAESSELLLHQGGLWSAQKKAGQRPLRYDAVVIGVSAGGLNALRTILPELPEDFPAAVIICQHLNPQSDDFIARYLDEISAIRVKEAEEKEPILPGVGYLAPPNYHLLVEEDRTFSLSSRGPGLFCPPIHRCPVRNRG